MIKKIGIINNMFSWFKSIFFPNKDIQLCERPNGNLTAPMYIMAKETWEEIIELDNKICEEYSQVCERCGRVPESDQEDCTAGKEITGGGLEPHIFKPSDLEKRFQTVINTPKTIYIQTSSKPKIDEDGFYNRKSNLDNKIQLEWSDNSDYMGACLFHTSELGQANVEELNDDRYRWEATSSNEFQTLAEMDGWWGTCKTKEEAIISAEQELLRWKIK